MELILKKKTCKTCNTAVNYNKEHCGSCNQRKYTRGIEKAFYEFKNNAHKRGIPFEVSLDYVEGLWDAQGNKCYLSGRTIDLNYSKRTASLDRIDSNKGYVKGNIKWCAKEANMMKYTYSKAELLAMAQDIARYHESSQV